MLAVLLGVSAALTVFSNPQVWIQTGPGQTPPSGSTTARPPSGLAVQWNLRGTVTRGEAANATSQGFLALLVGASCVGILAHRHRRHATRVGAAKTGGAEFSDPELGTSAVSRRQLVPVVGATSLASEMKPASAEEDAGWVQFDLNTGETLYDIDFDTQDPNHGFVVGARGLFYETKDGGKRWVSRSFANLGKGGEDIRYRFQTVSVNGNDVWIVGKPPLLLQSKNGGKSWKKVPVSRKLPGEPKVIKALGDGKAEMATSSGAVYITENNGKNWKANVDETVDATLNRVSASGVSGASYFTGSVKSIKRTAKGKYLAVAQRGNFYLTLTPGEQRWVPHNRISARRIQAMGFRDTSNGSDWEGVWMSLNGGSLTQTTAKSYDELGSDTKEIFKYSDIRTGGVGIIDVGFRTDKEAWAVGGSGVIYVTRDGGTTWQFDSSGTDLPCNLYNVKFFDNGKVGYMIGSAGILLRKVFAA